VTWSPIRQNAAMHTSEKLDRRLLAACERLGRALRAAKQRAATRHQLTPLQVDLLEILADRRRRIGELAAELDVTQPTVSDAVSTLTAKNLVTRTQDPGDRRVSLVEITDTGTAIIDGLTNELTPLRTAHPGTPTADKATALRVILEEIRRLQHAGIITIDRSCLTCRHYQAPSASELARCTLLDQELANHNLRVDCAEHQPQPT
jgi:DNA-binding MarR family transcriptional regulator